MLSLGPPWAALRRGLIQSNPIPLIDRPREQRRQWRIFGPNDVAAVERAFAELIVDAETDRERDDLAVTRRLFVFHMGTGLRRGEAAGLRWRSVFLADPGGAFLRVEEMFVRHATDTPKSDAGRRTVELGVRVADELFEHRAWSRFDGDDELVFPNPRTGRPFDANRYSDLIAKARAKAGIEGYVRPSHDLRHSSITNAARSWDAARGADEPAGHSSYSTTRRYISLAGARFREDADRLEARLWAIPVPKNRYQEGDSSPVKATDEVEDPHR